MVKLYVLELKTKQDCNDLANSNLDTPNVKTTRKYAMSNGFKYWHYPNKKFQREPNPNATPVTLEMLKLIVMVDKS